MIEGILVEGLIYGILALGVFISFRILDFPDLTVEGSFPAGAAGGAMTALLLGPKLGAGANLFLIICILSAGLISGALAGFSTAAIYHRLKVHPLLAGIITMTGFYSINLRILGGKPNLPLISENPLLSGAKTFLSSILSPELSLLAATIVLAVLFFGILDFFFHTEIGIAMGALGDNENSVIQAGINPITLRTSGIILANALAGLAGAIAASYQGFADVNFGQGVVASGLATVMLGELILRSQFIGVQLARVFLGSILFKALMYAARSWGYLAGITPNDLRFITALLIIGSISLSKIGKGKS